MNTFGCVNTSPPFQFLSTGVADAASSGINILQHRAARSLMINNDQDPTAWSMMDASGRELSSGLFATVTSELSISDLSCGLNFLFTGRGMHRFMVP